MKCPTCHGTRLIWRRYRDARGLPAERPVPCLTCQRDDKG